MLFLPLPLFTPPRLLELVSPIQEPFPPSSTSAHGHTRAVSTHVYVLAVWRVVVLCRAVEPALPLASNAGLFGATAVQCAILSERFGDYFNDAAHVTWSELGSRFQTWKWGTLGAIATLLHASGRSRCVVGGGGWGVGGGVVGVGVGVGVGLID
jgi:hypothetical protein